MLRGCVAQAVRDARSRVETLDTATVDTPSNHTEDDVPCMECGMTNREPDFILCNGRGSRICSKGGRFDCLGLLEMPEGSWHCPQCV